MTSTEPDGIKIRPASKVDAPGLLGIFDECIAWFIEINNPKQWGTEPWSNQPQRIAQITEACSLPGAWVAENKDGSICAALVLGDAMPYVPAADEPEVYVRLLIASRRSSVRGIGRRLMAFADDQARLSGLNRLRVDCYGGGSGNLIRFYESCGYTCIAPFNVDGWPGLLMERIIELTG
ncbi:GNAT family N-acetyltransferase [Aquitalea sp. ASV11]|uniref:GNAT family N-acetyltransferase n=1 Tax=Aquitalea sp. ASV11 TaxID=2795103 RepID=UPI0018EBE4E4|nr:GNAT family N-acetyltransferase [Aquitalea sp. ASV11]